MRRNPYYWKLDEEGHQLPYLDELTYRLSTWADRDVQAVAGTGDFSNLEQPENFVESLKRAAEDTAPARLEFGPRIIGYSMFPNYSANGWGSPDERGQAVRDLNRNLNFRKAITSAIDRERLGNALVKGPFTAIYPGGLMADAVYYDAASSVYYLRYTTENRNWFEEDFPKFLAEAAKPLSEHQRTDEHASHILEALETGRPYRGHFNVRNGGTITNLPEDCIIESPGFVDRFGINMVEGVTLPLACAATCSASVHVQRMAVEAAVTGDVTLLKQAVLHDPLVGAICTADEVWQMVDELLVAQAKWLPQYAAAIPAAKEHLKTPKVATRAWQGAARQTVRTVDELRAGVRAATGATLGTKLMG